MTSDSLHEELRDALEKRTAVIGVVGIGYIGLPTAAILASEGFKVTGFDIDREKVEALNRGECYIEEPDLPWIVAGVTDAGALIATDDFARAAECDVLIYCTQTPLRRNGTPDLSILFSAVDSTLQYARNRVLIICESTVPPGTTAKIVEKFLSTGRYELDRNLWVAHAPERVMPGRVVQEFRTNDRVIGGVTPASAALARTVYESFLSPEKIVTTQAVVSEFAKLAENTFRDVNIALANEMAIAADALDIDVTEAIALANRHPRVNIHRPGLGVGGHCLPKDPILLSAAVEELGVRTDLIRTGRTVNSNMPLYAAEAIEEIMNSRHMSGKRVLVLGTTFKENVDDTRNSPSRALIEELLRRGADVRAHDPKTKERFGAPTVSSLADGVRWADVIVLAVAHSEYLTELPRLDMRDKAFFDGRNAFAPDELDVAVYRGIGRPLKVRSDHG